MDVVLHTTVIPTFNQSLYLPQAIESVLMQKTEHPHELVIIDDGSTDQTQDVLREYAGAPNVKVVSLASNQGKGNAVRLAYNSSTSRFFTVLDSDDIYTSRLRIDKHLNFLLANEDCVAVGSRNFTFREGGVRFYSRLHSPSGRFDFRQALFGEAPYFHTSATTFRRLEQGLPEIFSKEPSFRGDTALLLHHLKTSGLLLGSIDEVLSAYRENKKGIWTSLSRRKKYKLYSRMLQAFLDNSPPIEGCSDKELLRERIRGVGLKSFPGRRQAVSGFHGTQDVYTSVGAAAASIFSPRSLPLWGSSNSLAEIDQTCEFLGQSAKTPQGHDRSEILSSDRSSELVFVVTALTPLGGGIFHEVSDFIRLAELKGRTVRLVVTRPSRSFARESRDILERRHKNLIAIHWINESNTFEENLLALDQIVGRQASIRVLFWVGHDDILQNTFAARTLAPERVFVFSYDHGSSLGVLNSHFTHAIVKNPLHVALLRGVFRASEVTVLPVTFDPKPGFEAQTHTRGDFVSATAAVRGYKFETEVDSISEVIPAVLLTTGGKHVHIGPLSEELVNEIHLNLDAIGISRHRFSLVGLAESLTSELIEKSVSLFIHSWPVPSARTSVEILSLGLPSIHHVQKNEELMPSSSWILGDQRVWDSIDTLRIQVLEVLNHDPRGEIARNRTIFEKYHTLNACSDLFDSLPGSADQIGTSIMMDLSKHSDFDFHSKMVLQEGSRPLIGRFLASFSRKH